MGDPKFAASRINLAQTFNAIGWILGPLLGSLLIFKNENTENVFRSFVSTLKTLFTGIGQQPTADVGKVQEVSNSALITPYVGLGIVVVLVTVMFFFVSLPEVHEDKRTDQAVEQGGISAKLISNTNFIMAVIAQFLYVAAQTGIGSFFVNYTVEAGLAISELQAGVLLGLGGMGLFALGRFSGSSLMKKFSPGGLLATFAVINTVLMIVVATRHDNLGILALIASYLFMSIMFPSIFALGIQGLGDRTKSASSVMVMTVAGGAVCPALMGMIGAHNMNIGFIIPMLCFAYIALYGLVSRKG